ncbi:MAG: response regulator [Prevotella sp.]|nr:response regulator [Prevotella sp.]
MMMTTKYAMARMALLACFLCWMTTAWSQDYVSSRRITSATGLSNDFVTNMAIDAQGYVWVGTEAGVNKIAGNTCQPVALQQQLSERLISALYWHQPSGNMLIGTELGLNVYDTRTGNMRLMDVDDGLVASSINDITAANGGVWLVYGNGNIQFLDDKTLTPKTLELQQQSGNRCAMDDGKGNLYIGHSKNGMTIVRLADGSTDNYQQLKDDNRSLPGNNVRCIYQDSRHRVWVGTDAGLALFHPETGLFTRVKNRDNDYEDNVYDIRQMGADRLWVATDIGGVKIVDLAALATHTADVATDADGYLYYDSVKVRLSSLNPRTLTEDEFGNIWVGNHSTGVDFISNDKSIFSLLDYTDQENHYPPVYVITKDTEQRLWMASQDELVLWQKGRVAGRWAGLKWIGREYVSPRCLMVDKSGMVWMGIDDQGVYRFDRQTATFTHIPLSPEGSDIHSFAQDGNGRIWIGGEFGVYLYESGKATLQESLSSEIHAPATCILQTAPQRLFLSTLGDGVYSFDMHHGSCRRLGIEDGLPSNKINHTVRSQEGGLWLATDGGLAFLSDPVGLTGLHVYGKDDGLIDSHILAVQLDGDGNVWMSTYSGISCFVPQTGKCYNYNYQDTHQRGAFINGAAVTDDEGTIYFGSVAGVCHFNPQQMSHDMPLSDVQIISCEAYNPVGTNTEILQLKPDDKGRVYATYRNNTLRLIFTVRNFAQTKQVDYSYKMKGMDDKWYDIGDDYDVVFRGLDPGHYTFILRAKMRNQDWTQANTTQLEILIAPPFWQTWWAYVVYALLMAAVVGYALHSYKRKLKLRNALELERRQSQQKQELNEERLRFFTNITHELRTPLTLILGPLDDLMDDKQLPPQSHRRVAMIVKSAERLRSLINEILEFRKTETQNRRLTVARGDIGLFVREICLNYKELYRNPKVQFSYDIADNLPLVWFDSEIITTILNNLLSNAIKYTEQGSITTRVETDGQRRLCITVTDTGYGISAASLPHIFDRYYQAKDEHQASGTGIGLALVKSLAELHEGLISVDSHEGQGSRFTLSLFIDNTYPNALHKEDVADQKKDDSHETTVLPDDDSSEMADELRPLLLVVEDNADIRQYIADSFGDDFKILQANNGEEGVMMAKEQIPDVIVSDIMMPRLNGIQLTRQLKDDIRTSHIPIILLTAKNTDEDKEEGYDSGADSYLTKPFTAKLLASRIQNLLTARRRMAEYITRNPDTQEETAQPVARPQLGRLDREFLDKLNDIIRENIMTQDIDLPFVTDKMAMSHSTFYRKVKALTGMTAKEYIRKFRLQHCYHLLESGDYNVNQAAMMTGFNQMAHFRETFKKEFGILPSEVIRKTKK